MIDERTRYFRRVRRLRRSARRWSVLGGALGGAAAILTPYAGIGLADAVWAGTAGGSLVLAAWRWADLRVLAAQTPPPPPDPAAAAERARATLVAAVERLPAGREVLHEVRRQRTRVALRGTTAAAPSARLDRAASALAGLAQRLPEVGASAVQEAALAENALRDLAHRVAGIERTLRLTPDASRGSLTNAHRELTAQLEAGVDAYERLVAAAAECVAADRQLPAGGETMSRLTDAGDLLHGLAAALAELKAAGGPARATS
ncbi:MAG TPA: hypothetical protein VHN18_10785 [Micromonosporaceae bacterium]|nr:hypothetical protein [Micromonosporaceae bacterium]